MRYQVMREHHGDRHYMTGDVRNADPADVAHLLSRGVLAEPKGKTAPAASNKAAPPVQNKAQGVPANKAKQ